MTVNACLFSTALGTCGLAWTDRGLRAVQLPEAKDELVLRRLRKGLGAVVVPEPSPGLATEAVQRLQQHLLGGCDPMIDLSLDLDDLPAFTARVYREARGVGPGQTVSYGELARRCGRPGGARAVGQALASNPLAIVVPCHRVLARSGGLGGFSGYGAVSTKLRLLTVEGADLTPIARAGVRELARRDLHLRRLVRKVGPFSLGWAQREDRFTALAEAIVHQQVSMAAGATIFRRVLALCSNGTEAVLDPAQLLKVPAASLRTAGLSRQKSAYLVDLATRVKSGDLPLAGLDRMDDDQVVAALTQVKGIGRWSAEMFLIFRLGRLDVLPCADLGLQKGIQKTYGLRAPPSRDRIRRLGEAWRPFRSVATWYLWRSLEADPPKSG